MASGIIDNFLTAIKDRVRNPLLGSFGICWLVVNYRTILVLFGDGRYEDKITYLTTNIYPSTLESLKLNLAYPLIGTVAYLAICYWPASWYYEGWYKAQKNISAKKKKIDGAILLTKKESIALQTRYQNLEIEHQKLKDTEEQTRGDLLNRINKIEEEKNQLKTLLKLPQVIHETSNLKVKSITGQLQSVVYPSDHGKSWRIEFAKETPDKYGFHVRLEFESRNSIRFDSILLDIQKFETKGLIEFEDSLGKVILYDGEKDKTTQVTGWIPLSRKVASNRFSITIRGDASEGWYQVDAVRFRDTTEQATN